MLVCPECRWRNPKEAVFCVDCGQGLKRAALEGKAPVQSMPTIPQPMPTLRAPQGPAAISGATILELDFGEKLRRDLAKIRAEAGGPSTLDDAPPAFLSVPPLEGAPTLDELTPPPLSAPPLGLEAEETIGGIPAEPTHNEALGDLDITAPPMAAPSGDEPPPFEVGVLRPPPLDIGILRPPVEAGEDQPPNVIPLRFGAPRLSGLDTLPPLSLEEEDEDDDEEFEDGSVDFSLNGEDLEEVEEVRAAPPPLPQISYLLRPISSHLHALLSVEHELILGRSDTLGVAAQEGDPFVEPQHARLRSVVGGLQITDLSEEGGVWVRLRPQRSLRVGALIRLGGQLLRLERCAPPPAAPGGALGATCEGDRFRLVQLDRYGRPRDVHHISAKGSRVGRRLGELIFPDDPLLSPVHAVFIPQDEGVLVRDLESQNGTWARLAKAETLDMGDVFLLGRSAWRVGQAD